jgi:hypothetical protein
MISYEIVRDLLDYDPETGIVTYRKDYYKCRKGSTAGYRTDRGYLRIKIEGKHYRLHRVIWLWMYGTFPENTIDHINRVKSDNRISNLRDVTQKENCQNRSPRIYST